MIIQKKFPSGFFFATSGLFFALTLLVIFLSDDPAGLPAAVAYISCLIISITSAFAPFIASYFINLDLRLHQIEGAIVDLGLRLKDHPSDLHPNRKESLVPLSLSRSGIADPAPTATDGPTNAHFDPEMIERSGATDSSTLEGLEHQQSQPFEPLEAAEGLDFSEIPSPKLPSKQKKAPPREKLDEQDTQLSLFSFVDTIEPKPETPLVTKIPSGQLTRIVAYILLESDASLHLVGDIPFSWEEALELSRNDVGSYLWEGSEVITKTRVAFQSSTNRGAHRSAVFELKPGITNELYPEFVSD